MLQVSLVLHLFFFCLCAVEEIGFCPLAQRQNQIVCCSQVDLISASAHVAAPLPVEISFSLLPTQKKGKRRARVRALRQCFYYYYYYYFLLD